jgi:hypothetical protein
MTPEQKAEWRDVLDRALEHADGYAEYSSDGTTPARMMYQLFDEIERLRQLVREAHVLVIEHADDWDTGAWCRGCMWNHVFIDEEADPPWELDEWFDTIDEAHAAHVAHVETILNGGAK